MKCMAMVACVAAAVVLNGGLPVFGAGADAADQQPATAKARTGGCFCGAVRYEVTGPVLNQTVCHCLGCKRSSGAAAVPWITVSAAGFRVTQGTLAEVRAGKFPKPTCDGNGGVRSFCAKCGTPICFRGDHGTSKTVDITVGSLDDAKDFAPTEDVFPEQRMPWVKPVK